jgi:triosephosphate isomerase
MIPARRPLLAGNWKMNGLSAALAEIDAIGAGFDAALKDKLDLLICPPATLIARALPHCRRVGVALGAQDCHPERHGAHTGDISAEMLADVGASAVIVGHSERRADHGETDALVAAKTKAAIAAGLQAIVCVGETRAEREAGAAETVVGRQIDGSIPGETPIDHLVIAYEPVWAIGTGLTPTPADVAAMHGFARRRLAALFSADAASRIRILYGGSVKPSNAGDLMRVDDVDGALVGGASLKAADFLGIAAAFR